MYWGIEKAKYLLCKEFENAITTTYTILDFYRIKLVCTPVIEMSFLSACVPY